MPSNISPGFLVAAPSLRDPNFDRAVVLLVEHHPQGSLGFIVNRAAPTTLRHVLDELGLKVSTPIAEEPVLIGGPVAPTTGWIVFDARGAVERPESSIVVDECVGVSASRGLLEAIARGDGPARHVLVLGYAGWGAGQLDAELEKGAWIPTALDASTVFDTPLEERWERALRSLGIDPRRLVTGAAEA
jgi:putative transcriptional regulator